VVLAHAAAPFPKTGWSANEIANIDKILRNGLGINAERGDQLVVSAMNFPAKAAVPQWWEERDNIVDMSTYAMYAIGRPARLPAAAAPADAPGHRALHAGSEGTGAGRRRTPRRRTAAVAAAKEAKEAAAKEAGALPGAAAPALPGAAHRSRQACRWCRCWKTTICRRQARPSTSWSTT
jgi:flagellar M-ring protein FliF